ncbi:MAG: 50S ribosomal protein L28 [Geminicoccaceae bacterium]|nr:MAG: 50S ribosomal protein L28 [Geminicoccaceae bacterium]
MARRCVLTGKGVLAGNNVSHANNRTRRRYLPNIQSRRFYSERLATSVRLKVAVNTLRTIEKRGGLDGFLLSSKDADLPAELRRLKQRLVEAEAGANAA